MLVAVAHRGVGSAARLPCPEFVRASVKFYPTKPKERVEVVLQGGRIVALTITNVDAMVVQRNVMALNDDIAARQARLSTGLRIQSAKDDASGLAMGTRLRSFAQGIEASLQMALLGINIMQTGEAGMSEHLRILQRLRLLAIQSMSGTLSDLQRQAIQQEVKQLIDELERIANTTKFDEISLLNRGKVEKTGVNVKLASDIGQITFGGGDTFPAVSRDGTKVAFSRGGQIWKRDLLSGTETQLTTLGTDNRYAVFSPDGQYIYFSSDRDPGDGTTDREIYRMDANLGDGAPVLQLTNNAVFDSHPDISPDGTTITYATDIFGDPAHDIATMSATLGDSGPVTQWTSTVGFDYQPRFSPDGSTITYTTDRGGTSSLTIATLNAPLGAPTYVAFTGNQMENSVFDPTGNFILLRNANSQALPFDYGIFVTAADGSTLTNITKAIDFPISDESRPVVSFLNGRLVFSSDKPSIPAGTNLYSTTLALSTKLKITGERISLHVGPKVGDIKDLELTNVTPGALLIKDLDFSTQNGATQGLLKVDDAMEAVLREMSKFGAQSQALEKIVSNLEEYGKNTTASLSRVEDANMAQEVTALTKDLIQKQISSAVQAQANLEPMLLMDITSNTAEQSKNLARERLASVEQSAA